MVAAAVPLNVHRRGGGCGAPSGTAVVIPHQTWLVGQFQPLPAPASARRPRGPLCFRKNKTNVGPPHKRDHQRDNQKMGQRMGTADVVGLLCLLTCGVTVQALAGERGRLG